ncbi:hypothetical protein B7463_g4378, partial [Scytalidium lignicola]
MAKDKMQILLQILEDHDIPVDKDVIKAAFSEPELAEAWMNEYLGPETLLSKEEATLYSMLTKKGEVDELASPSRLESIREINDQELEDAIEELKRSTAAIEKQNEAIKLTKSALDSVKKTSSRTKEGRAEVNTAQTRKWALEGDHIRSVTEALSKDLSLHAAELESRQELSESNLKRTVEDLLRSDDKLLSDLQKLASGTETGSHGNGGDISRIKDLCAKLIKYTVEGVRTRLDRIYLTAVNSLGDTSSDDTIHIQEVVDLQEEIESLYSEILPVAQMAVEQQYLEPALREISARDGKSTESSIKAMKYVDECITLLLKRTEVFVERVEEYRCYQMAMRSIVETTKKELESDTEYSPPKAPQSNPPKPRRSSISAIPAHLRPGNRRSTILLDEDLEPEEQIFRNLGISIPVDAKSNLQRAQVLDQALSDRTSKLENHASSLQSTIESSIKSHIQDAYLTLRLLLDAAHSDTPYGTVQLLDSNIESSLREFQTDIEQVQQSLADVDLQTLQAKNVHRDQIIQRWLR